MELYKKSVIFIGCPKGLSNCLKSELETLGYRPRGALPTGVEIEGTLSDAMVCNLNLRTAHHVLYLLSSMNCKNALDLYNGVKNIPWELIIPSDGYLSVVSNVSNPTISDTRYANQRCKDAIVDRIMAKRGRRPDSGPDRDKVVVSLFWRNDLLRVYLDTSGESLDKRGYRKIPLDAPMQETLAAGVILSSRWKENQPFVNPMCGSGTLAIEASLIANNIAPGLLRKNFGFMHLLNFDRSLWESLKDRAVNDMQKQSFEIIATDNRQIAVDSALTNAQCANVDKYIEFAVCDFSETRIPEGNGVVVFNPEYGMRLGEEASLKETYRKIGDFMKRKCKNYTGYIYTGNSSLAANVGLKARRKMPFQSGKIECRLYEYDLF
jgi:putative N6-adenine-specific DNA methylase